MVAFNNDHSLSITNYYWQYSNTNPPTLYVEPIPQGFQNCDGSWQKNGTGYYVSLNVGPGVYVNMYFSINPAENTISQNSQTIGVYHAPNYYFGTISFVYVR